MRRHPIRRREEEVEDATVCRSHVEEIEPSILLQKGQPIIRKKNEFYELQ